MQQLKEIKKEFILAVCLFCAVTLNTQNFKSGKKISTELFGLFFEDINYAAEGGRYARLVQNRSFEYNPAEHRGCHL